jgi:tetratricopeptide (TPR) repeat protein
MSATGVLEPDLTQDGAATNRWAKAAHLLEQALESGCQIDRAIYLLALAHKKQGKGAEARNALLHIANPDAHVFLQLGLLSLKEQQLVQAEQEFARALHLDPALFAACYNLLLTRLSLGQIRTCAALAAQARDLAPSPDQQRQLEFLRAWFVSCGQRKNEGSFDLVLADMTADEENSLIDFARGLGRLEVVLELLQVLAVAHPTSMQAQEAYIEAVLLKARHLVDRCEWTQAEQLLKPFVREHGVGKANQVALLNLLGCCACLNQDSETASEFFRDAIKLAPSDPRLQQNLALALESENRLFDAEPHWNRYFDLLDRRLPSPPGIPNYPEQAAYVGLSRLAGKFAEKEKWPNAIQYQLRAMRLRPKDADMLERLFHLYAQAKRPDDARKTLRQLQELKPHEPQYLLYELDLIEVNGLRDIEHLLGEVERVHEQYPNDARVDEKMVNTIGNIIPLMGNLCDQYTDQLNRVLAQIRRLPNYQINWSAVYDVMSDLQREFHKLRRITNRCLPLLTNEEHRRVVRNLAEHIDRKIEVCRSVRA